MTRTPRDDDRARFERDRNAFFRALDGLDHAPVPDDSDLARLLALNGRDGLLDAPRGAADLLELGAAEPSTLDRYELGELLGRGGMGIVHRAVDRETGAAVAVKFLRPSLVNDGFRRRFAREVATLERLDDPGFGRLLDSGTFASPLGDVPYLVTELIEGGTLMGWAQEADAGACLDLLIALCRTLAAAHRQGVVHRDLKPGNILIDTQGRPRILDFGLAGLLDTPDGGGLDDESIIMLGTIRYMSPEQLHAGFGEVDARADVFALGILGYELLTGAHPFGKAEDPAPRTLASILLDQPPATDLDPELDQVLRRAMAKPPAERYADAAALGADLERCRGGGRTEARRRRTERAGRKVARVVGAVAVLAALVFGVAALLAPDPYLTEEEVVAEIYGHLEKMEDSIHRGVRSETSLTSALEEGMEATRLLSYLGDRPAAVSINRYICFRMGEAHLFLGWLKDDFQHFRAAHDRFGVGVYRSTVGQNVAGLDTTLAIVKRIRELTPGICSGSRAFAMTEMAEFGDTRRHLQLALLYRDDGVRRWCEHLGHPRRPYDVERPDPFPFHDLGRAAIDYGREIDDVVLVFLGLHALDHVAADHLWAADQRLGHAAYQESYAVGLAALAQLLGAPVGLDRILQRLDEAQAIRGMDSPFARTQTRLARAEILLNWSDRFGRREDLLRDARENARLAVHHLAENGGGRREAQARVLLARLDLRMAADETAARGIAAELEAVRGTPDFDALPVLRARWLLARAELGRAYPAVNPDWRRDLETLPTVVSDDTNPDLLRRARALLRP